MVEYMGKRFPQDRQVVLAEAGRIRQMPASGNNTKNLRCYRLVSCSNQNSFNAPMFPASADRSAAK